MQAVSVWVIPTVITVLLVAGFLRGVPLFSAFLSGAKEGLQSCVALLPTLIGLLSAVTLLRESGLLPLAENLLRPISERLGVPGEILPLMLLRPVSGSGSIALLEDLFRTCGTESLAGRIGAIMAGATETTFYTVSVYFGAVGVRKTKQALPAAAVGDLACTAAAVAVAHMAL